MKEIVGGGVERLKNVVQGIRCFQWQQQLCKKYY